MRAFAVRLPSGGQYWTVLNDDLAVFPVADQYLRNMRFGRDRAESTTKAYAIAIALFLRWCERSGRDWRSAAVDLALFMVWLKFTPPDGASTVMPGPGARPVRGERRINGVLTAVRGFLGFAMASGEVPKSMLGRIYELADTRDLPLEAQSEDAGLQYRLRAQHRVPEPDRPVERATDAEIVALVRQCRSARDRLIVLLMSRAGLRRSEVAGLRRSDLHLLAENHHAGCAIDGAHVHVRRRDNVNGAWAKSRQGRAVPIDFLLVQAIDQYTTDRAGCPAAADSDFLLINLFRAPVGAPMRPDALNELVETLSQRAELSRRLTPHMCRHAFASNIADAGAELDEVQALLGHGWPSSAQPYLHPDRARLREAVDRVPTPRQLDAEVRR